jgi:hypothetical protein
METTADPIMASQIGKWFKPVDASVDHHTGPATLPSPHRRSTINKREKSFFVAYYVLGSYRHRCHVLNISQSGALIAGSDLPTKGETFRLELASTFRIATVVWNNSGRRGINFDVVLTREQLTACL